MNDWKQQLKQLWRGRKRSEPLDTAGAIGRSKEEDQINRSQSVVTEPLWQPRDAHPDSKRRSIIIGFDFGTAFTKVVVGRRPGHVAIPFPGTAAKSNYLVPSSFVEQVDGLCVLRVAAKQSEILHTELKMPLLDDNPSEDDRIKATAFVALVLRHIRNWILQEYDNVYRNNWLDWQLNLGVATENYHDNKVIDLFKHIASAAWAVSVLPDGITLDTCRSTLTRLHMQSDNALPEGYDKYKDRLIHTDDIEIVPEIVAQVASYTSSPQRQNDLHMLIDIGAGTLDVVLFNVGEDKFPIMAKAVYPLGAEQLRKHRLKLLPQDQAKRDELPMLHMDNTKAFAESHQIDLSKLTKHDQAFQKSVGMAILKPIQHVKEKRYPTSSRWHEDGVPSFVVGGGCNVDLYSNLIDRRFAKMPKIMRCSRHELPQADDLDAPGLEQKHKQRLSVAYGLSFDPLNLSEIKRADEIPDQEVQAVKDPTSNYISQELM